MTVLEIFERVVEDSSDDPDDHLVLDHGQREKARFKAVSRSGLEVRVFLDRGQALVPGEVFANFLREEHRSVVCEGESFDRQNELLENL